MNYLFLFLYVSIALHALAVLPAKSRRQYTALVIESLGIPQPREPNRMTSQCKSCCLFEIYSVKGSCQVTMYWLQCPVHLQCRRYSQIVILLPDKAYILKSFNGQCLFGGH
jgi:hypothetical protein